MAGQLAPVSFLEKSLTKKYNWSLDFGMIEISCFRDTSRSEFKEPFLFRKKKSSFILELKFQNLKPLVSNSPKRKNCKPEGFANCWGNQECFATVVANIWNGSSKNGELKGACPLRVT